MSAPERISARGQIVSLWEMLERHALLHSKAICALEEVKWTCAITDRDGADSRTSRLELAMLLDAAIDDTKRACILSDMDATLPEIERLSQASGLLLSNDVHRIETVTQQIKHLVSRLKDDLSNEYYFHLDGKDVSLFTNKEPFGSKVSSKFPKAIEDIEEAAKCLAVHRSTACVFHLMRVMEIGINALGKKMKVRIADPTKESWYNISNLSNKAIGNLPAKTTSQASKKQKLSVSVAHLNAVRIAWRNEVMHPKQTYTREKAHEIFGACRVFMISLESLI